MREHDALIRELLTLVDHGVDASNLLGAAAAADIPALHRRATETFGSWEAFLVASVVHLRRRRRATASDDDTGPAAGHAPPPERVVGTDASNPALFVAADGPMGGLYLDALPASRHPRWIDAPVGPDEARPTRLIPLGQYPSLALFTTAGNAVRLHQELMVGWSLATDPGTLRRRFFLTPDEHLAAGVPLRVLERSQRYYSISAMGLVKPTDSSELVGRLSSNPNVAFLIRDGDALFDVLCGPAEGLLLLAGSGGKAIAFDTGTLRSQGRKAGGVRGIGLEGDERVVGATFIDDPKDWLGLVTAQGLFKRVALGEFRSQGRGGAGLQTCKLNAGDEVAAAARLDLAGDAVVLTSVGRMARFPAWRIPAMGRPAKGDPLLSLQPDEQIIALVGVPAGDFADAGGALPSESVTDGAAPAAGEEEE